MQDVEESLNAAIEQSGALILTNNLPDVKLKRVHLLQLFQNLVCNAIKYRSEQPLQIQVTAERKGMEWRFSVRDNGIGTDPKYKQLVFGIFKRCTVRNTKKRVSGLRSASGSLIGMEAASGSSPNWE